MTTDNGPRIPPGVDVAPGFYGSRVDNDATVGPEVGMFFSDIGGRSVVGGGCVISHSSVGRGVVVGDGVLLSNSVVGDRSVIGRGAKIIGVELPPGSFVPSWCVISGPERLYRMSLDWLSFVPLGAEDAISVFGGGCWCSGMCVISVLGRSKRAMAVYDGHSHRLGVSVVAYDGRHRTGPAASSSATVGVVYHGDIVSDGTIGGLWRSMGASGDVPRRIVSALSIASRYVQKKHKEVK